MPQRALAEKHQPVGGSSDEGGINLLILVWASVMHTWCQTLPGAAARERRVFSCAAVQASFQGCFFLSRVTHNPQPWQFLAGKHGSYFKKSGGSGGSGTFQLAQNAISPVYPR